MLKTLLMLLKRRRLGQRLLPMSQNGSAARHTPKAWWSGRQSLICPIVARVLALAQQTQAQTAPTGRKRLALVM
jgi:hypothetical protein